MPDGYRWAPLAAWGDPLTRDAPGIDPNSLDPAAQRQQVGYSCDFAAWFDWVRNSGIVGVSREYTNPGLMFPNYPADTTTRQQVDYEIATGGQPRRVGINDGIFFVPTEGSERGYNRQIFSGVDAAECASLIMNSAQDLMLVSVQHPGEGGTREERVSTFGDPVVNRPTVVAVTRTAARTTGQPLLGRRILTVGLMAINRWQASSPKGGWRC